MSQIIKFSDASFFTQAVKTGVEQGILDQNDGLEIERQLVEIVNEILQTVGVTESISNTLEDYKDIFHSYIEIGLEFQSKGNLVEAAKLLSEEESLKACFRIGYSILVKLKKKAVEIKGLYKVEGYSLFPNFDTSFAVEYFGIITSMIGSQEIRLGKFVHKYSGVDKVRSALIDLKKPVALLELLLGKGYKKDITDVMESPAWSEYVLHDTLGNKTTIDIWLILSTVLGNILIDNRSSFYLIEAEKAERLLEMLDSTPKPELIRQAELWFDNTYPEHAELKPVFGATMDIMKERSVKYREVRQDRTNAFCHKIDALEFKDVKELETEDEYNVFKDVFSESSIEEKTRLLLKKKPEFIFGFIRDYTNNFTDRSSTEEFARIMAKDFIYHLKVKDFVYIMKRMVANATGVDKVDLKQRMKDKLWPITRAVEAGDFEGRCISEETRKATKEVFVCPCATEIYLSLPSSSKKFKKPSLIKTALGR